MAKKRGGGQPAPEAWIGRDVMIGVGTSGARVRGALREVSDRGVVLHYSPDETGRTAGHIFYPWSTMYRRSSSPMSKSSPSSPKKRPDTSLA